MQLSICFICDEYPPISHGGIGSAVKILAEELVKKKHNVYVVGINARSLGGKEYEKINGVEIWRLKHGIKLPFLNRESLIYKGINKLIKIDFWGVKKVWENHNLFIEKLIEEKKIDVIEFPDFRFAYSHINFQKLKKVWPQTHIFKIAKLHGSINFLRLEHSKSIAKNEFQFEQSLLNYADQIISLSPHTTSKIKEYYDLDLTKTIEIFNGLKILNNRKSNIDKENFAIFSGSLVENKGIETLLKSWNIVCNNHDEIVLKICGKGVKQKFTRFIKSKNKNRIVFTGHLTQTELFENYRKAKVAIFPSHTETFGLAPVESMMLGCPTIGSEIFSKTWFNEDKKIDEAPILIHKKKDVEHLAELILKVLENETLQSNLAKNGINYVKNKFDINTIVNQHIEVYKSKIE